MKLMKIIDIILGRKCEFYNSEHCPVKTRDEMCESQSRVKKYYGPGRASGCYREAQKREKENDI